METQDSGVATLLLRLAGPLQSWGISSRYSSRDTGSEPSKSGVVGILAAALGRGRDADVTDLARLRMGVRVDVEGVPGYDFQTVGGGSDHPGIAMARDTPKSIARRMEILARGGEPSRGAISISNRYYLQDAVFLVGLESDDVELLERLDEAVRKPVFPIGLGRRSFVPSVPIAMRDSGIRHVSLGDALQQEPWPVDGRRMYRQQPPVRLVVEASAGSGGSPDQPMTLRNDQPVGAAFQTRVFGPRAVTFLPFRPNDRQSSDAGEVVS